MHIEDILQGASIVPEQGIYPNMEHLEAEEKHHKVLLALRNLKSAIHYLRFQEKMSSSTNFVLYQRGIVRGSQNYEQTLVVMYSFLLDQGLFVGMNYKITLIESAQYGGEVNTFDGITLKDLYTELEDIATSAHIQIIW